MNKKIVISLLLVTIFLTLGGVFLIANSQKPAETGLDDFAKCLTSKGIIMYGAAWCSHCQKVKAEFGSSFKYINYVECPADPQKCINEGVTSYPTWKFSDGTRLEGEQSFQKIAEISRCNLPIGYIPK